MVISHQFKYVFVQTARTASSSIGRELCQCYGGEPILSKHALYSEFVKQASDKEKRYFVFTGQRNPLDELVSRFFKAKYQKLEGFRATPKSVKWKTAVRQRRIKKWRYISENDLSFEQFFNRYHCYKKKRSYMKIERKKMDYVYRFEQLQEDFSTVLKKIGIQQMRELPRHSKKTLKRASNFYQYYTPGIQPRVQLVFGKSFTEMGYCFPVQWPQPTVTDHLLFLKDFLLKRPVYP